ncbi:hypothetical protein ACFL3V_03915 [Nanoarchaeota archaeon]
MPDKKYVITGVSHGWRPEFTAICLDAKKADKKGEFAQKAKELENELSKIDGRIAKLTKHGPDKMTETEKDEKLELINKRMVLDGKLNLIWEAYKGITSSDSDDVVIVKKHASKVKVGQVYTYSDFQELRN